MSKEYKGNNNNGTHIHTTEEQKYHLQSPNLDYRFHKECYERGIFRTIRGNLVQSYEALENTGDEELKKKFDEIYDEIIACSKNYLFEYKDLWLHQLKTQHEEKQIQFQNQNCKFQSFKLAIAYPGLVIGLGNPHGTAFKGDIQLGMSFDYVTGLPFVSGSSLKGKLRSIMEKLIVDEYTDDPLKKENDDIKKITLSDYLQMQEDTEKLGRNQIAELVDMIFEGVSWGEKDSEGKQIKNEIPMGDRDVFYGGMIIPGQDNAFLKDDYLAPHPSKIESPNVLKFLAIAPGTEIEFFFSLKNSELKSGEKKTTITAEQKAEIFFNLLKDFGIGAKTNVGYGIME